MAGNDYPDLSDVDSHATDKRSIDEPDHAAILAGDYKDDDGAILDAFFEANPNPSPAPTERPQFPNITVDDAQPVVTRLLSRTFIVDPTQPPVMLLPADPNRKSVRVSAKPRAYAIAQTGAVGTLVFTYTVPAGLTLDLATVMARLTTSAVAGNRSFQLRIIPPPYVSNNYSFQSNGQNVAASLTRDQQWTRGLLGNGGGIISLPEIGIMPEYWTLELTITTGDVGDQVTLFQIVDSGIYAAFQIASSPNELNGAGRWGIGSPFFSDYHTGAVWCQAQSIGPMEITIESVTV